ncbi:iron-siderophore ABC transporter substrate-binding protein [Aquihabitans sp. G128]|uniref:iron-siderophore ABC transporter substrate-binding protein n=1 Tax=Aquihabitans sp. G128 TaxID=2849779 RepID=UPI001C24B541|nr:iron-siderophore ABC transporter substrate-binding protein [Aquihabitans sp. G128]QXC63329.1 iron-siderophore ABC transporter substrate-binding protein [Aquihabitans sp. G128]
MSLTTITTPPPHARRRRRALTAVAALLLASGLAACGSDGSGSDAAPATTAGRSSEATADAKAFPVTIEHKYGSTELTEAPKRVVVVGLTDQDAFIALGTKPVATTEWFGEEDGAIWPWATEAADALPGDEPEVLEDVDGINFEKIASLRPDVIVGLYSGMTEEDYGKLSDLAPTVAQPGDHADFGIPWQESTHTVGQILGKVDEADALVADVEAHIAEARKDHPELEGKSAAMAMPYEGIYVYGDDDPRSRFLTALGMEVPREIAAAAGKDFGGNLSLEKATALDVDVLVWIDPQIAEGALGGPLYSKLAVHTEGREVLLDSEAKDSLGGATSFVTVLSLPFLVDGLVPRLAQAVDGDPATKVAGQ